eukprot:960-Heterococcus_DN1.PRE.4
MTGTVYYLRTTDAPQTGQRKGDVPDLQSLSNAYISDTREQLPPFEELFNLQEQDSKKQSSGGGIGGFFGKGANTMHDCTAKVNIFVYTIFPHCTSQLFGGGDKKSAPKSVPDTIEQVDFGFSSSIGAAASNRELLDTKKLDGLNSSGGRNQRNAVPQRPAFGQRANTDAAAAGGRPMCKKKPPSAAAANSDKLGTSFSGTAAKSAAGRK